MQRRTKTLLIASLVTVVVAWAVSWLMVFKFGYQHEAWFGIGKASYDESESFAFLTVVITSAIACFVAPVLVFSGLLEPATGDE